MKKFILYFMLGLTADLFSQNIPQEYFDLVQKADSLYNAKDYKNSVKVYSSAFKVNGWKGTPTDRYNAACTAALANIPDTAFFYLDRAILGGYQNYKHLSTDPDLAILHEDKRWKQILEKVKENKEKAEANLNKPLVKRLDSILESDQAGRMKISQLAEKHGWDSKEVQSLFREMRVTDSINTVKVTGILDKYGWLGPEEVGNDGNSALFLVIQHADLPIQEKYLPMMREAVKNRKAHPGSLALLEDRVALRQGKKQIYGSQIAMDPVTKEHYVDLLEDPDNVDKRRAEVGLPPLSEYVKHWNFKWDVEKHKKFWETKPPDNRDK